MRLNSNLVIMAACPLGPAPAKQQQARGCYAPPRGLPARRTPPSRRTQWLEPMQDAGVAEALGKSILLGVSFEAWVFFCCCVLSRLFGRLVFSLWFSFCS